LIARRIRPHLRMIVARELSSSGRGEVEAEEAHVEAEVIELFLLISKY
jgi:hypothetical protein